MCNVRHDGAGCVQMPHIYYGSFNQIGTVNEINRFAVDQYVNTRLWCICVCVLGWGLMTIPPSIGQTKQRVDWRQSRE